ncbi:hypothetical protein FRB93_000734 [Tulasnella sp. JGI-2019a]|nr:hypothetical protein FRB93_000734 [Tulasnella sp. JGI-2019a]
MTAVHIALTFSASTTFAICLSLEAEALPKRLANGPNLATDAGDDQSPPVGTALGFSPCFIDARFALAHHRFRRRSKPVGTVFGFLPCFIDARIALARHRFRYRSKPVETVFGFSPCFIARHRFRRRSKPVGTVVGLLRCLIDGSRQPPTQLMLDSESPPLE